MRINIYLKQTFVINELICSLHSLSDISIHHNITVMKNCPKPVSCHAENSVNRNYSHEFSELKHTLSQKNMSNIPCNNQPYQ